MVARCLEVRSEDVTQRRLALDALFLLGNLLEFAADRLCLGSHELVDDRVHLFLCDFFLLTAMCHQREDFVGELCPNGSVALELFNLVRSHSELLHLDLSVLVEREVLDALAPLLLSGQVVAIDESLHGLLESFEETILLHGLDDHVGCELLCFVVHEDDSILGVVGFDPVEEFQESGDFRLCLDDL